MRLKLEEMIENYLEEKVPASCYAENIKILNDFAYFIHSHKGREGYLDAFTDRDWNHYIKYLESLEKPVSEFFNCVVTMDNFISFIISKGWINKFKYQEIR